MFVEYKKTKEEFISSGLTSVYYDNIVLIKGGDKCIYSRGEFFANFNEYLSSTNFFKGIKVNNKYYNAAQGGGYLSLATKDPSTIEVNVNSDGVVLGLSEDFVKEVKKAIYTIEPSVNSIHLSSKGLNTSILDVWVNIDGSSHIKVDDQSMLDSLGMSVWYSIDDDTKRHKLIIGGSFIMETEEGDAIIVAEDADDINDDNLIITLESESIDISSIKDKINLHLILNADANGYGEELNRIYIPVTKDGGHLRAITIIEPSTINQYLTGASIDIDKCHPYIRFSGSFSTALSVMLPSIPDSTDYFNVRQHIGSIVCIYNNSGSAISINGRCKQNETTLLSNVSIAPNNFGYFVCKCTVTDGKEDVYWETRVGAMYN